MVAKTDGRYRRALANAGLEVPTSIAVDPQLGRLFWADAGSAPKIEVSWMDGSKRRPLITEMIRHPAGLTIDYSQDHMVYWVDTKLNTIEVMKPDGSMRKAILKGDMLKHPVSLDVFESYLYWITRDTGELLRQDKFGRGVQVAVQRSLANPSSLKVYHDLRYNTSLNNPCFKNPCSHLCLLVPGGRRCSCPDNTVQQTSHRSTAEVICDAPAERPRPSPRICPCQNGGLCREDDTGNDLVCVCLAEFSGAHCEFYSERMFGSSPGSAAAIYIPILVAILIAATVGLYFIIKKRPFGKPSLTSSQSVSFRPGTNVEFNSPDFPSNRPPTGVIPAGGGVAPLDGYSLDTLGNKTTDFSNPMYDAVQSGTNTDPSGGSIGNGSGIYEVPSDVSKSGKGGASSKAGPFSEPVSAILAPSSITHRTSPQLNLRPKELNPSFHDTGKDTQLLVEEDKSEC